MSVFKWFGRLCHFNLKPNTKEKKQLANGLLPDPAQIPYLLHNFKTHWESYRSVAVVVLIFLCS